MMMKTYLFADMEFSGLDKNIHKPLEIAIIAADKSLKLIKAYTSVFYWEDVVFNPWSESNHAASGLLDEICDGKTCTEIDSDLTKFCSDLPGELILAGQSVHIDKDWINQYLPHFAKKLNHRVFDLSTIDMILEDRGSSIRNRSEQHRAMPDARAALKSAQHYASNIVYSASLDGAKFESRSGV